MLENIIGGIVVAALGIAWRFAGMPLFWLIYGRGEKSISGVWEVFDDYAMSGPPVGEIAIRQRGRRVRMQAVRRVSRNGRPINRKMLFKGIWRAEQLTATFFDAETHYRGGAVVLRWVDSQEPNRLFGKTVYWDRTPDQTESADGWGIVEFPYALRKKS